uniref:Ig-like domain-containing protein n=1 Tax=Sphaeramia orbicularis TaxID=375764 RepID=A0A673BBC0_9TELE
MDLVISLLGEFSVIHQKICTLNLYVSSVVLHFFSAFNTAAACTTFPPLLFRTVVEITSGDSKVFSGESVRLRCSIPDNYNFTWRYLWFRGSKQLPQNGENIVLWNANIKESGKYYCQGFRNSIVGKIHTLKSLPVEITVDGGWAILQVPPHPGLVGESLIMTCHVRGNPPIREAILYKDGVEVLRQNGSGGHLHLTNLTLEDGGLYSCRASWDTFRHTVSVISTATQLQVLGEMFHSYSYLQVICLVVADPAPPMYFYFYKNNKHLAMAISQNYILVTRSPGTFTCMAMVPQMGVSRQSDPKSFGQVTGTYR